MRFPTLPRLATALMALCAAPTFAQDVLWEKSFGGKHAEYLSDAVPTADYGFILAGSSLSSKSGNKTSLGEGDLDYWIWKMDEKGEMEWQKSFGGSGSDFLQCIRLTRDGGFFLAGHSNSPKSKQKLHDSHGDYDFWVIKLDAGGGEQWQKSIGGSGDDKLMTADQTKDGGYILGGSSSSERNGDKVEKGFGSMDYWIVKLGREGNIEWQKTYGGMYFDELRSIQQTRDGGYIVGGYSNSPDSGNKSDKNQGIGDYWILKLDRMGDVEWQKVIGGDRDDQLAVVHQTIDGGYILGGNSNSQPSYSKSKGNGKGTDFWVVKLDENGDVKWQETYDFGTWDILTSIVENKDKTLLVGGYAKSEMNTTKDEKGINDYIALKMTDKGVVLWQKTVGSDGDDALKKLIETRDGAFILAGTSSPTREMQAYASKSKNGKGKGGKSPIQLGTGQNKAIENATNQVNERMKETMAQANESINEVTGEATTKINKALDTGDSPFKMGVNQPTNLLGNAPTLGGSGGGDLLGSAMEGISNSQPTLPASGDKKRNFGNKDFWVVKLKDKAKTAMERSNSLEASPNPTGGYTNIIINYDYQSGTATVVDVSGHVLETIPISSRTVPVDLGNYPEGIYFVNVKTEVGNEGVKVIKKK